ncbi:MAG: nucleotide pyrophosphohydrolase [Phycisphaerae bacterium]|nr:nucleotide pyrophosphohydrolase [Phycisphaerae bacterium]
MTDETATIADLKRLIQEFVNERDWSQFHTPKNLSMSIAIEAAELMEHFQWTEGGGSSRPTDDPVVMQEVREELADILCYALSFANALGIDVNDAVREKMVKNAAKYPSERYRGRFR